MYRYDPTRSSTCTIRYYSCSITNYAYYYLQLVLLLVVVPYQGTLLEYYLPQFQLDLVWLQLLQLLHTVRQIQLGLRIGLPVLISVGTRSSQYWYASTAVRYTDLAPVPVFLCLYWYTVPDLYTTGTVLPVQLFSCTAVVFLAQAIRVHYYRQIDTAVQLQQGPYLSQDLLVIIVPT